MVGVIDRCPAPSHLSFLPRSTFIHDSSNMYFHSAESSSTPFLERCMACLSVLRSVVPALDPHSHGCKGNIR